MSINKVMMVGNLTKDPTLQRTQSGKSVCSITVALNRGKNQNGEDLGADYINVQCWNKVAENVRKFLKKGSKVGVVGRLNTRKYDDQNGRTVYVTEVVAEQIEFLSSPQNNQQQNNQNNQQQYNQNFGGYGFNDEFSNSGFSVQSDDLPF